MSEIFRIPNYPDINLQDFTSLKADADSGQDEIEVVGVEGMGEDNLGLLGQIGSLIGEIVQIDTVTDTTIKFDTDLINSHRRTEPFTILFGSQIKGYRALNVNGYPPLDSSFAPFNPDPFDIDQDSPVTYITDPDGGSDYWYKFTYINPVTSAETPLSASIPARGGGFGHYVSVEDVRREAGLMQANQVQDTQIATRRDNAESEVKGVLMGAGYQLPLTDGQGNYYTPPMIENIARILSAGYVLMQDYGAGASGNSKDGKQKVEQAQAMLLKVQNRDYVLVDINDQPMANRNRVRGWPDDTTKDVGSDGVNPEPAFFSVSKKF